MSKDNAKDILYKVEHFDDAGCHFIKITAQKAYFNVTLCDLGASIYEVFFNQRRMTLTPKYTSDFKQNTAYGGKTIGRVNGRIKDAKIVVDGIEYQLDKNEGKHTLHGGRNGLSTRFFDYRILNDKDALRVVFYYRSPHLDAGFPEDVDIYVTYIFPKKFEFPIMYVVFDAECERETVMKLTNHTYWCLGDCNVKNMFLTLYSDQYATYDEEALFKKAVKVKDYPIFKRTSMVSLLKGDFPDGIDNYFYINKKHNKDHPVFIVENFHTSSGMAVYTNFDGIVLYTDNFVDGMNYFHTHSQNRRGLAIEPSFSPNSNGLISKEHPFHRYIIYEFFCPDE